MLNLKASKLPELVSLSYYIGLIGYVCTHGPRTAGGKVVSLECLTI